MFFVQKNNKFEKKNSQVDLGSQLSKSTRQLLKHPTLW